MPPRTLVVVLNWNGAEHTKRCVESLAQQTHRHFEVLVIDNGSTENRLEPSTWPPSLACRALFLPSNTGFAGGMNIGFNTALEEEFEYVWLLNQDTAAFPDCLERLLSALDRSPDVAVGTPVLVNANGERQAVGGYVDWSEAQLSHLQSFDAGDTRHAPWLTGTALLLRVRAFPAGNPFATRYFAYWEDVELSTRVIARGGKLLIVEDARMRHVKQPARSASDVPPIVHFLCTRNAILFLRDHAPPSIRRKALLRATARLLRVAGYSWQKGCSAAAAAMLQGLTAGLRGQSGPPPVLTAATLPQRKILEHFWGISRVVDWLTQRSPRPAKLGESE